jgi:hypothetical protein
MIGIFVLFCVGALAQTPSKPYWPHQFDAAFVCTLMDFL